VREGKGKERLSSGGGEGGGSCLPREGSKARGRPTGRGGGSLAFLEGEGRREYPGGKGGEPFIACGGGGKGGISYLTDEEMGPWWRRNRENVNHWGGRKKRFLNSLRKRGGVRGGRE